MEESIGSFVNIFETVGVWGLIVIAILYFIYLRVTNKNKIDKQNADNKNKIDTDKSNTQAIIDAQNFINEHDEKLVSLILSRINYGVVHTVEDEERNCHMNEYLDNSLQCLLEKTGAHRAFIFSYHNGERSIDGRGFQKMSCTNEKTVSWVSPIMPNCQNLQRAMLSSIYKTLISQDDLETA